MKRFKVIYKRVVERLRGMSDTVFFEWDCPFCDKYDKDYSADDADIRSTISSHLVGYHNIEHNRFKMVEIEEDR